MRSSATTAWPSLALVCPTIGRPSLEALLQSFVPHMEPGDQVIVVGDGPNLPARQIMLNWHRPDLIYTEIPHTGHWGAEQVEYGIRWAKSSYICLMGDDDAYLEGVVPEMRKRLALHYWPHLFAARFHSRVLEGSEECGGMTGQQFVFPNEPSRIAPYPKDTEHNDHTFFKQTMALWGGSPIHDPLILMNFERRRGER